LTVLNGTVFSSMLSINIKNETATLKSVILGTASSFGGTPPVEEAYDPKSKVHITNGTFPKEEDLAAEMEGFASVLQKHGVKVYRPESIDNCNQIFARDIGFVIDNKFVSPRILENRKEELSGINYILDQLPALQVVKAPEGTRIEGGDVMPWGQYIFVGYSEAEDFEKYVVSRTNRAGVEFLRALFPEKIVRAFELNKSDTDPYENALHLDCCFQPIGHDQAIIYKGGFKNVEDYQFFIDLYGADKVIDITKEEMYMMNSNVFSISPEVVVSEAGFERLNREMENRGFTVERINYSETAKMEGLLRCSTLPLLRD